MRVLAGDLGGTKTALAIVEIAGRRCRVERFERYHSADHSGLEAIVEVFLASEARRPKSAGFGVAGPVRGGRSTITNLHWKLDERRIARSARLRSATLLNDFAANAHGLRFLGARQVATLARGHADPSGPIAVLGAGTGLGAAALLRADGVEAVVPSEGGHVDFGPRSNREDRLVAWLRQRFGRATRERILSGSGLVLLHEFLVREGGVKTTPAAAAELEGAEDRAAAVSRLALVTGDPLAREALAWFAEIYGSEAGNLALQYRATGGVYLAGGIAPKILPALRAPGFLEAFRGKPPMRELLAGIPVRVVLDARLGLYGAAAAAARRAT